VQFAIDRDQIYIGRDPGNDVVIQDVGVTGYHARIIKTERGDLLIEERTSTGIWFEEQKVPTLFLANGTRFRLGNTGFVFEMTATLPGALAETVKAPSIPEVPPPPGLEAPPPGLEAPPPGLEAPPPLVLQAQPAVATPIVPTPPAPAPAPAPAPPAPRAPTPAPAAPAPPPASPAPEATSEDGTPAWASAGLSQLSMPAADGELAGIGIEDGDSCPGCEASLIGLERFCAICGTRTKYGRRGRVMMLKVITLLLILGAGFFGLYTLTDGDLSRDGLRKAISRVVGEDVPSWLEL
jgi:pSer/pThr/pTyr-binding forkhead associated (FHA) protein